MITSTAQDSVKNEEISNFSTGFISLTATVVLTVVMVLFLRRLIRGRRCTSNATLHGKTVIVTGCNTGIGKETARDLAKRGAKVIMACRNIDKANAAADEIKTQNPKANVVVMALDLASFDSIRKFANEVLDNEPHIEILINNAGLLVPKAKTKDGYDMIFGTNHLGTFLLTNLLLERIKKSVPARIVTVSSRGHTYVSGMNWEDLNYDRPATYPLFVAYFQSKLANVLFSKELANKVEGTGVTTYCLHPGVIRSDFGRDLDIRSFSWYLKLYAWVTLTFFAKTVEEGAQTTIYCAVDEKLNNKNGLYYSDCRETNPSRAGRDTGAAKRLWDLSLKMVGIENDTVKGTQ